LGPAGFEADHYAPPFVISKAGPAGDLDHRSAAADALARLCIQGADADAGRFHATFANGHWRRHVSIHPRACNRPAGNTQSLSD